MNISWLHWWQVIYKTSGTDEIETEGEDLLENTSRDSENDVLNLDAGLEKEVIVETEIVQQTNTKKEKKENLENEGGMDSDSIQIKADYVSDLDSWNETANVSGPKVINFEVSVKALAADNGKTDDLKARKSLVEKEQSYLEAEDLVASSECEKVKTV